MCAGFNVLVKKFLDTILINYRVLRYFFCPKALNNIEPTNNIKLILGILQPVKTLYQCSKICPYTLTRLLNVPKTSCAACYAVC